MQINEFAQLQPGQRVQFRYQNQDGVIKDRDVLVEAVYPAVGNNGFDFVLEGKDSTTGDPFPGGHRKFYQSSVVMVKSSAPATTVKQQTPQFPSDLGGLLNSLSPLFFYNVKVPANDDTTIKTQWLPKADGTL